MFAILVAGLSVLVCFTAQAASIKLLSANIGNSDLICTGYSWKLCLDSVEKKVTASIRAIDADIVVLQEVVSAEHCRANKESKRGFVCYDFSSQPEDEQEQARRILGPDYTIAVTKGAYEAVAVKKGRGHIKGCADGSLCLVDGLPIPASCDQQFSITPVDLELEGKQIRLINGHPDSISSGCRSQEVEAAFKASVPGRTIMAGDWNLDPYRGKDKSVRVWEQNMGEKGFAYLSGIAEKNPPYHTIFLPLIDIPLKTLDHVITDFALGSCRVLGVSPGSKRLDRGFDLDHRGILCELKL